MKDPAMLEAVERYIRGEMLPEELAFFEHLRKTQPAIDELVAEHTLFLQKMGQYGEISRLKSQLKSIHEELTSTGQIDEPRRTKVVVLWKKYKRVVGVAAAIAGITALAISGLFSYVSPKSNRQYEQLNRRLTVQEGRLNSVSVRLTNDTAVVKAIPPYHTGGTGFLIDPKGYLLTNAHVVKGASRIGISNGTGQYRARLVYINDTTDLAILKIEDSTFKSPSIPYGISRTGMELGEEIFTLGYPRNEIVYGKGYMSAKTGYDGDTLSCQITVPANPGNSGTPVLNKDGDVVGIIQGSQQNAQGFVFAIRSKNIFQALGAIRNDSTLLKNDSVINRIRLPLASSIKGLDREHQIQKIQDCIFIVKR